MTTRILVGDVRERLADIPDASVQCCITSPPYFNLRDYNAPGQIGLEPTLADYVAELVGVFRQVRRVLRDDATCWINLGDSYAASGGNGAQGDTGQRASRTFTADGTLRRPTPEFKPKDLMMVPARVAIALQDDGWYLRSDIIWAKPNPMPESVTDRPTSAHEHVFLLSKSPRYYYDGEAIREDAEYGRRVNPKSPPRTGRTAQSSSMWRSVGTATEGVERGTDQTGALYFPESGRNKRNVWTVSTAPFPGAHFATFPPKLVEPTILAGTSEKGCCPACGSPWVRVVEREHVVYPNGHGNGTTTKHERAIGGVGSTSTFVTGAGTISVTTGWQASCACPVADPVPCTVLDPFLGAGTTLLVADRLGRNGVGVELNPEYARMAEHRIRGAAPLFAEVAVA